MDANLICDLLREEKHKYIAKKMQNCEGVDELVINQYTTNRQNAYRGREDKKNLNAGRKR